MEIKVIETIVEDEKLLPVKAHATDAGYDLKANEEMLIPAYSSATISTGVKMAIPAGCYGKIESRSSLYQKGLLAQGVIDSGYRGEIKVIIWNLSAQNYAISKYDRIAQIIILPLTLATPGVVHELEETERGTDGFGSTGRN